MTFNLQEAQSISEIPACRGPEVLALLIEVNPIQEPELQRSRERVNKFCSNFVIRKIMGDITVPFVEAVARRQFHGLAGRRMANWSGTREQRISGGLASATRRQKKSSNLTASPSNSGKNRNSNRLPNAHDDLSLRYQRSWKEHRGAQRRTAGCINRRIHSPPSWDW